MGPTTWPHGFVLTALATLHPSVQVFVFVIIVVLYLQVNKMKMVFALSCLMLCRSTFLMKSKVSLILQQLTCWIKPSDKKTILANKLNQSKKEKYTYEKFIKHGYKCSNIV